MRSHRFNLHIRHGSHHLRVEGSVSPGRPQRGPTYSCGGEPAEPPEFEYYKMFLLRGKRERLLDDPDCKLINEIEDQIFDELSESDRCAQENRYNEDDHDR